MKLLKNTAIWLFVTLSFFLSSDSINDDTNPILISFSFTNLLLLLKSSFFKSVADFQICITSGSQMMRALFLAIFWQEGDLCFIYLMFRKNRWSILGRKAVILMQTNLRLQACDVQDCLTDIFLIVATSLRNCSWQQYFFTFHSEIK